MSERQIVLFTVDGEPVILTDAPTIICPYCHQRHEWQWAGNEPRQNIEETQCDGGIDGDGKGCGQWFFVITVEDITPMWDGGIQ